MNEKKIVNIPKIIHQTWKDINIPIKWIESPEKIKKHFPDWEYKLWTDKTMELFVQKNYQWFYQIYKSYKYHIQRVDTFRYLVLHNMGGLYMDLDIVPTTNFQHLFIDVNAEVYLPKTPNVESYTNCIMASKKDAKFWEHVFQLLIKNSEKSYYSSYIKILWETGPRLITDAVNSYHDCIAVLPRSIISQDITSPEKKNLKYTKALVGKSWHNKEAMIITNLYAKRKYIFILFLSLLGYWIYLFFIYRRYYLKNN